jgi:hypothetical protein
MLWTGLGTLLGIMALASASSASVLTPERLLTAPRPGPGVANPSGSRALVGVKTFSFKEDKFDKTLYHLDIPSNKDLKDDQSISTKLTIISKSASAGVWLSDDVAAYVDAESNTLYAKDVSAGKEEDTLKGWETVGVFPAPIDTLQVARTGKGKAVLVFSAQVYGDGDLEAVKKHDKSEAVKEWDRVKGGSDRAVLVRDRRADSVHVASVRLELHSTLGSLAVSWEEVATICSRSPS